jgi:gliding motility-associated-like protein
MSHLRNVVCLIFLFTSFQLIGWAQSNSSYQYRVTAYKLGNTGINSVSNIADAAPKPILYIPSAFTPNGDGINDVFFAKGDGIKRFSLTIYNRWGEIVFYSDDINNGWDGTVSGEKIMNTDVFSYHLKAYGLNTAAEEQRGLVTLIND